MRPRGSSAFSPSDFLPGLARAAVILVTIGFVSGCATTPPTRLDLHQVLSEPQSYHNQRIEITGYVVEYEPARGDTYRTLHFALGSGPEKKVSVFSFGYGADSISKASDLVGEAFRAGEPISVVGELRAGEDPGRAPGAEIRLESVEFRGRKIDVTRGRRTRAGFDLGDFHITPSILIDATITP